MTNSNFRWMSVCLICGMASSGCARTGGSIAESWSLPLLQNTCVLGIYVAVLTIPIGITLAFLISRTDLIYRRSIEVVLYAMLFIPAYLHVAAWDAGFGLQGWVCQQIGMGTIILDGWRGAVWIYFVTLLPWVVLIQATFFRLVPRDLEDQTRIDATRWQVVRFVTLRASLPGVIVSLFWIFIQVANEVTITDVYQIRTYAEEVYTGFALGDSLHEVQLRVLPGVGLICCLAAISYFLISMLAMERPNLNPDSTNAFPLGKWRTSISICIIAAMTGIVLVPIFNLCWKAGVIVEQTETGRVRSWALGKLVRMIIESPVEFSQEIAWSILLGQLSSVSAVLLSFVLAWRIDRRRNRVAAVSLMLFGLAIPGPILALIVARVLNFSFVPSYFYDDSIVGVWFVLVMRTFPIAFFLVHSSVRSLDRSVLESARIDGASGLQQIFLVGLPIIFVQLLGAWLISLIWSMGELSGSVLITPPGIDMISKSVFDLVHYGVEDRLAGICLFCVASFVCIAGLGMRLVGSPNKKS